MLLNKTERAREREKERERERERERGRERERERERQTDRQTDRQTVQQTDRQDRERERERVHRSFWQCCKIIHLNTGIEHKPGSRTWRFSTIPLSQFVTYILLVFKCFFYLTPTVCMQLTEIWLCFVVAGFIAGLSAGNRDFAFFCVWTNETSASRNLRSYLVLQRLCNEAALSPGIDAFLY